MSEVLTAFFSNPQVLTAIGSLVVAASGALYGLITKKKATKTVLATKTQTKSILGFNAEGLDWMTSIVREIREEHPKIGGKLTKAVSAAAMSPIARELVEESVDIAKGLATREDVSIVADRLLGL